MRKAWLLGLSLFAAGASLSGLASAQSEGFALNRFDPSERGSDWFSTESLDLRGHNRSAFGLVGDWSYKPLVLYDSDGDEIAAVVEHQLFAHLGFSHIMWDRVRFGASLPVAVLVQGEDGTEANASFSTEDATTIGDVRLGADLRLMGEYGGPLTTAVGLQVHLPTGSQDSFTGDGSARIVPRFLAAGDVGDLTYSGRLGLNIRTQNDNFADEPFGTELLFGAAVGMRLLDDKLTVGPEVFGSTVVSDSGDGIFARKTTPFELIAGGHYRVNEQWQVGAGVGPGLTRGFGAPKVRVLASVEWFPAYEKAPPPPPPDRDGDGILDAQDACPEVPGVRDDDPAKNGCPPPSDRDGDGIVDEQDACPDEPGVQTDDPQTNGCPPPKDRDGDGIVDEQDACPDEPGVQTDDPQTNGCPPPKDRDGDGIVDEQDACPDEPGV
ncbi:MAG: transporter, partial [Myxococcota bacterium]